MNFTRRQAWNQDPTSGVPSMRLLRRIQQESSTAEGAEVFAEIAEKLRPERVYTSRSVTMKVLLKKAERT